MTYQQISFIVTTTLSIIAFIVVLIRTGSAKTAAKSAKELMENMAKYRASDYKDESAQTFTNERVEYTLNKHTNELEEKPIKTDLAELIQSSVETAFERVLQRLIPDTDEVPDTIESDYDQSIDDLNDLAVAIDVAEEYREKLGLPLEMSVSEIFGKVNEYSESLKQKLSDKSKKEYKEDVKKVSEETDPKGE